MKVISFFSKSLKTLVKNNLIFMIKINFSQRYTIPNSHYKNMKYKKSKLEKYPRTLKT
jgi:hypothetical protein